MDDEPSLDWELEELGLLVMKMDAKLDAIPRVLEEDDGQEEEAEP